MGNSRDIALVGMIASIYAVLVQVFHPISFLVFQVRVANILMGLVPIMGWTAIIGLAIGCFFANMTSPLGIIDLLSPLFGVVANYIVWKLRNISVFLGLTIYSVILGSWVTFMLWWVFGVPFLISLVYVTVGIWIATAVLGYMLYKTLVKVGVDSWLK